LAAGALRLGLASHPNGLGPLGVFPFIFILLINSLLIFNYFN
jgi:hypothetical protein